MKLLIPTKKLKHSKVAPLTGAWIEIFLYCLDFLDSPVAPLTGAWIEISFFDDKLHISESLPSRERGLKLGTEWTIKFGSEVAPLTGAWIEIIR